MPGDWSTQYPKNYGIFREEKELLSWLIDEETLEIPGRIEEVGRVMLDRLLREEGHVAVLFYDEDDDNNRRVNNVLNALEKIDEQLDKSGVAELTFPGRHLHK